ncbi:MAG: TetR/AcrR family transcriptional regulator [Micromonosporaceae bacterium]
MAGQTRENSQRTHARIMDVALELFAAQGVAATTVTAIEAGAGLAAGSGSFYRHFPDKSALLSAVVDRELTRVTKQPTAQLQHPEQRDRPAAEALAVQLRADLDFLADLRSLIAILMWERDRAPEIAERVRTLMLERGVELGVADLLFATPAEPVSDDPAAAATVMMSAMVGYHLSLEYFGSAPADVGPERFTTTLARLLTRGR